MIVTRKLKVVPTDKEFYTYFRNKQREQNKALHIDQEADKSLACW